MTSQPDILVIMNDDMGFSDIGCFGGEINTPNLDKLAGDGVRMTHFYNTARCCPTRASILTGLHPHQAGVGHMIIDDSEDAYRGNLNPNTATLAEALKGDGYSTYMSGKWHVAHRNAEGMSSWPMQRGFDHFWGLIDGSSHYFNPHELTEGNRDVTEEQTTDDFYMTDAIADHATQFVAGHAAQSPDDPMFMYLAFTAPHWPLHAREEDIAKYKGRFADGWDTLRQERLDRMIEMGLLDESNTLSQRDAKVKAWEEAEHKEWEQRRMETYAAQIEVMDQGIGRVVDMLGKTGRLENTLILFLADNGGCAEEMRESWWPGSWSDDRYTKPLDAATREIFRVGNEPEIQPGGADTYTSYGRNWANLSNTPFREYKCWVHEGGISTPLIAHWPERLKQTGAIRNNCEQFGQLPDIMATVLDAAGASYPRTRNGVEIPPCEGYSLLPILAAGEPNARDMAFWEHEGCKAVRWGKYKAVTKLMTSWELYDIETDRIESHDLAQEQRGLLVKMVRAWNDWADRIGHVPYETLIAKRQARQERTRALSEE